MYENHLFSCVFRKRRNTPLKHPFPSKVSATPTRHTKEAYKGPYKEATPYSHNPASLLSLIFPLFTLPLNSRTRADRCVRPCWECLRGLSTVSDLEEGVSPKAGEKTHSNEPFAQSHSKQQTHLYGQCVRQMLQELRQNSRFVAKNLIQGGSLRLGKHRAHDLRVCLLR